MSLINKLKVLVLAIIAVVLGLFVFKLILHLVGAIVSFIIFLLTVFVLFELALWLLSNIMKDMPESLKKFMLPFLRSNKNQQ
jgi:divalent metal cation (Fe/Co/Zn/Cd) transporter